jgi:hypothetical protein
VKICRRDKPPGQDPHGHYKRADFVKYVVGSNLPKITIPDFIAIGEPVVDPKNEMYLICCWCEVRLISQDIVKRRCLACHQYFRLLGESIQDIILARNAAKLYSYELDISQHPEKPIVFYYPSTDTFETIYMP